MNEADPKNKKNSNNPAEGAASSHDFLMVGIGASAGGIKALREFFAAMPPDCGMAFVIILHLSEEFESNLASILQTQTEMKVTQVNKTLKVEPNNVYVIPPAKHLKLIDGVIKLADPERIKGKRVPIDLFFGTLAEAYHSKAIAVVLSGTGSDGTIGIKRVKEFGGIAVVQDPQDAEYDAMPRSAINTDLVDVILPAAEIPAKLMAIKKTGETFALTGEIKEKVARDINSDALKEILSLLRIRTGHDFRNYKQATVLRRIAHRLQVHDLVDIFSYIKVLREDINEINALLRDLLITVTYFFRDKEAFEALESGLIPKLFENKTHANTVRVWVCACATGEEAFSMAILLNEYAARLDDPPKIQVFASDISDEAINIARESRYEETIINDVSPERLQRFFVKEDKHYRIKKEIRDTVLFAPHNVLHDPPFSRLDLVTCRNFLIYLNRETQDWILELFHFALNPEGYLFLGSSESSDGAAELYSVVDKKQRFYQARPILRKNSNLPIIPRLQNLDEQADEIPINLTPERVSYGEIHYRLVEQFAPPSILITDNYDIVHISEHAGRYLRFIGGEPTHNLLKVINLSLKLDLHSALIEAQRRNWVSESRNVRFELGDEETLVNITVHIIDSPESARGFYLIIFDESKSLTTPVEEENSSQSAVERNAINTLVNRLEGDLMQTKDRLRTTIEQHETSVEELKASNEELQAINEELRSATEELETSKEELQSVNEELTTVNHELKDKVDEISRANSDLQNLMGSTEIGIIFLDREFAIKRYTPPVTKIFNIIASDVERPFEHLTHKLDYHNLQNDAAEVLQTSQTKEIEVFDHAGRFYIARIAPYRTIDEEVDGVVLSFLDITDFKEASNALRESEEGFRTMANTAPVMIWIADINKNRTWFNKSWLDFTGRPIEKEMGSGWTEIIHPEDLDGCLEIYTTNFDARTEFEMEYRLRRHDGEYRWFLSHGIPRFSSASKFEGYIGSVVDIHERKQMEEALKDNDRRKNEFIATLAHELRNPLAPIRSGLEVMKVSQDIDEKNQAQKKIERLVEHIIRLVDDLLDISRITQNKIELQKSRVELSEILESAVETARPLIDDGGHHIKVEFPDGSIWLKADKIRLVQIFLNLLSNAAKFSESASQILINVAIKEKTAVVRIKDNGLGITKEMLPHIWEMFSQVELSEKRRQNGLGIGLYLVKQLTEMHGGTIEAKSEGKNKGSEFIITLPLANEQTPEPLKTENNRKREAKQTQRRILIVDDNLDAAEMLEVLLTLEGHIIQMAFDGNTAIETAKEFAPEVVLLDIGLPDMNGYEVAEKIRPILPESLLIALTGWGQESDRLRSKASGFNFHLVKPVEIEKILQLIQTMNGKN